MKTRVNNTIRKDLGKDFDINKFLNQNPIEARDYAEVSSLAHSHNLTDFKYNFNAGDFWKVGPCDNRVKTILKNIVNNAQKRIKQFNHSMKSEQTRDEMYTKAKHMATSQDVEDKKEKIQNYLSNLEGFSHQLQIAYNDTESKLKEHKEKRRNLTQEMTDLKIECQRDKEYYRELMRNGDWSTWWEGVFGAGKSELKRKFAQGNYQIDISKTNDQETTYRARRQHIESRFDDFISNYMETRSLESQIEKSQGNAVNYLLSQKNMFDSSC
ncbi:MAG: hypothetical protein ABEJ02_01635 [Candidatus Paceibacteria bacterium]